MERSKDLSDRDLEALDALEILLNAAIDDHLGVIETYNEKLKQTVLTVCVTSEGTVYPLAMLITEDIFSGFEKPDMEKTRVLRPLANFPERCQINVALYILEADFDRAVAEIPKFKELTENLEIDSECNLFVYEDGDEQIALVEVEMLNTTNTSLGVEAALRAKRIPYDKYSNDGVNFRECEEFYRVTQFGAPILQRFKADERGNVSLTDVYHAWEMGIDAVFDLIEAKTDEHFVIPWSSQVNYLAEFFKSREGHDTVYLMNKATGNVDTEENWIAEMFGWHDDPVVCLQELEALYPVVKSEKGGWVESGEFDSLYWHNKPKFGPKRNHP